MALAKKFSFAVASAGFMVLAAAAQALAVELTYDRSIGSPGFAPGQLAVPQGIAIQPGTGNVFIGNGGNDRLDVFDQSGNFIKTIGSTGSGPGQFKEPAALEFDKATGNLYVGDVFNNRINVFDSQGNYLKSFGSFGGPIPGRAFFGPGGVTFDQAGNFYVSDFSNDKINKYTKDGDLIGTIGSSGTAPGQFQGPAAVRVSPVSGNFYVSDQYNNRIQVLDPEGKPLLTFGSAGSGPGQLLQPIGLEVDQQENVYVADSINSRVEVFDKNGNFLTSFGKAAAAGPPSQAAGPSAFGDPLDLTPGTFNWTAGTNLNNGKLYVSDFFQGRVQVLDINNTNTTSRSVPESSPVLGLALLGVAAAATTFRKNRLQKLTLSVANEAEKNPV